MFLTKTRLLEQENNVPTKEGLIVELDVALLYHISPDKARDIYVDLGENYEVGAGTRKPLPTPAEDLRERRGRRSLPPPARPPRAPQL